MGGGRTWRFDCIRLWCNIHSDRKFSSTQSSAMHINCFQRNSVIKNSLIGQSDFIRAKFCALTWTPSSETGLQPCPSFNRLPHYLPMENVAQGSKRRKTTARVFSTMFLKEILKPTNFCHPCRQPIESGTSHNQFNFVRDFMQDRLSMFPWRSQKYCFCDIRPWCF